MQCQGLPINFEFRYEDGLFQQTAQNVFATFDNDTDELIYDLDKYRPAPGVRLFQFNAITDGEENDQREVTITQPFVILPEDFDAATDYAPTQV